MKFYSITYSMLILLSIYSCKERSSAQESAEDIPIEEIIEEIPKTLDTVVDYDTASWSEITWEKDSIVLDLRYATKDNFTEQIIYPCARCFLRPVVAQKIRNISEKVYRDRGVRLKLFDCYRPSTAQEKLWSKVPNASYVTPPSKGSMHNRGLAVDLTVVDKHGIDWDMGSEFDDFSRLSHSDNKNLPDHIIDKRSYLKEVMTQEGLKGIRTEWWHYSHPSGAGELSKWEWNCETK